MMLLSAVFPLPFLEIVSSEEMTLEVGGEERKRKKEEEEECLKWGSKTREWLFVTADVAFPEKKKLKKTPKFYIFHKFHNTCCD